MGHRTARSIVGVLVLLLGTNVVTAAPLDDALDLVVNQNAAISARQAEACALAKQSPWTSEVRLGYQAQGTREQAAGLDAGISVKIPLFDRKQEIDAARARYQLRQAQQELRGEFINAVGKLVELAGALPAAAETCAFTRDRLDYVRQAVDEGREEADALWPVAGNVREAEQTLTAAKQRYCVQFENLARTYGGERWTTLRDLLAAHVRARTPSMSSAAAPTCW